LIDLLTDRIPDVSRLYHGIDGNLQRCRAVSTAIARLSCKLRNKTVLKERWCWWYAAMELGPAATVIWPESHH